VKIQRPYYKEKIPLGWQDHSRRKKSPGTGLKRLNLERDFTQSQVKSVSMLAINVAQEKQIYTPKLLVLRT